MIKNISKENFGTLAICAIRYCQGRQTYMPDLVRSMIVPHLPEISDNDLNVMIEDCVYQERMNLFGDERIDKPGWMRWKELLEAERKRRAKNERSDVAALPVLRKRTNDPHISRKGRVAGQVRCVMQV